MKEDNPKEIFDKAYSHLRAGDIREATAYFQTIARSSKIFGIYAARIAQQRILWYCIPLDAIFVKMEQNKLPVDIHSIIVSLFSSDDRYIETDVDMIIKSIEEYLAKMPGYICVGKNFWAERSVIENLANSVAFDLKNTNTPVSLKSVFLNKWPKYCLDNPKFPDHYSEAALVDTIQKLNSRIRILAGEFVVTEKLLHAALDNFARMVGKAGQPLCLNKQMQQLFPDLSASPEAISILEKYLASNLDNRFVEYIPGFYLTQSLLKFNVISFDDLFSNEYLPIATKYLLKQRFPDPDVIKLNPVIKKLIQSQLLNNPHLVRIGEENWISRTRFDAFQSQVIQTFSNQDSVVSLDDLLKTVTLPNMLPNHLDQLQEVILVCLRANNQAIQVTKHHWLHRRKITSLLDKAYKYLLGVSRAHIDKIVQEVLIDVSFPTPIHSFSVTFEDYLRKDPRFTLVPNDSRVWRAIPIGQRDNDAVYKLLVEINFPITDAEIKAKLQLSNPEYALTADSRFKSFPNSRWALSSWIFLNDYVYDYLLHSRQHLHENVVVGLVCEKQGIRKKTAFFFPKEDSRFVQDEINRWFCRYQLKPDDLNRLLVELDQYAGAGRKLELLFQKILHLHPDSTDASEVLSSDNRFINLDNLWYSRRVAFHELSPEDLEQIYTYFSGLPVTSPAISIKDIGLNAVGWDGRFSNAAELLAQDDRYIEKLPGFWILSAWSSPNFERISQGGVPVQGGSPIPKPDGQSPFEPPEKLTKRDRHAGAKSSPDLSQKKFYHTLSQLDIIHGNIRISGTLKQWIPESSEAMLLVDEEKNELLAHVNETHTVLDIHDWIQKRQLSYGDKFYLQPGSEPYILHIRSYGKRDQRVYQEAIQHQNIEKLIAEAREVNMSYHDLMIEVMKEFYNPLHREDIFQLVDYRRTATRSTIFEILSLTECPYEELRYFVPKGKGFWIYDEKRKKAFDMKMKELLDENVSLRGQLVLLTELKKNEQEVNNQLLQLQQQTQIMELSVPALVTEKSNLSSQIQSLQAEKSQADQHNEQLSADLSSLQQKLTELSELHTSTIQDLECLRLEQQAYLSAQAELEHLRSENHALQAALTKLEQLRVEQADLHAKASQLPTLQAELDQHNQLLEQLRTESAQKLASLEELVAARTCELDALRDQLQQVEAAYAASLSQIEALKNQNANLQVDFDSLQAQSQDELSALVSQAAAIKTRIEELTNQNQVLIDNLAREQSEKQALQAQLNQTRQQFESIQERSAQVSAALESRIQTQAQELASHIASIQSLESQLATTSAEKVDIHVHSEAEKMTITHHLSKLQAQMDALSQAHNRQTQDLAALEARLNQFNRALSTPLGRLFARLQGLKVASRE